MHMHVHTYIHTHTHTHKHTHTHVHTRAYTCIRKYILHTYIHTHTLYKHIHTYTPHLRVGSIVQKGKFSVDIYMYAYIIYIYTHTLYKHIHTYTPHLRVGSIVQKGKFSAGTDILHSRLKKLDFPTFGIPTMPAFRFVPGLSWSRVCPIIGVSIHVYVGMHGWERSVLGRNRDIIF
jgi:hypothetical protein